MNLEETKIPVGLISNFKYIYYFSINSENKFATIEPRHINTILHKASSLKLIPRINRVIWYINVP